MKPIVPTVTVWAIAALLAAIQTMAEPPAYHPTRLPDGHVDMEGMWTISNLTPLERRPESTRLLITAAEAKQLEDRYFTPSQNQAEDPDQFLEHRSVEKIRGEFRSSQIIEPEDGKLPWNEAYKAKPAELMLSVTTAFDNPELRPGAERCLSSTGAPPMQPTIDGNMYQFVQTPETIVIVSEMIHDARMIRMNGAHSPAVIRSWLGDSIGWWEKDTLVVETKYFSASSAARFRGRYNFFLVSPQTIVTEKFTRVSDNELNYVFTVRDPTFYTQAWTGETHLLRSAKRMFEFACHEGNYSMRDMLEAARAKDAEAAAAAIAK